MSTSPLPSPTPPRFNTLTRLSTKQDGNALGHGGPCGNTIPPIIPTPLILQLLSPSGLTAQGRPKVLTDNLGVADQGIIEAPSLVYLHGNFILFFSSGCFATPNYTVSYATASSIAGPYVRGAEPLFRSGAEGLVGPGGMSVVVGPDGVGRGVFHGWRGEVRGLFGTEIGFDKAGGARGLEASYTGGDGQRGDAGEERGEGQNDGGPFSIAATLVWLVDAWNG